MGDRVAALTGQIAQRRPTHAEVDLDAITDNVRQLAAHVAPAALCAVVKADGYGHGAVESARAACRGGAAWLAVALVEEGVQLRQAGVDGPILVLSEPPPEAEGDVADHRLTATVYSHAAIDRLAGSAAAADRCIDLHLKVDTGMHRVGAQPSEVLELAADIARCPQLRHTGTFTHLAVADAPDDPFTATQLRRFDDVLGSMRLRGFEPGIVHAANSAGALAHPAARYDMVRCGIAIYGQDPDVRCRAGEFGVGLRPAIRLVSAISHVKVLPAGERLSYGQRYELGTESVVVTVPIGYADGVPRRLSSVGGEVLIGGRRCPIAGRVTMDQILVDWGPPPAVGSDQTMPELGDPVVLLGGQGDASVGAWEWAMRLDTIAYEITCGISGRVPRRYTERSTDDDTIATTRPVPASLQAGVGPPGPEREQ